MPGARGRRTPDADGTMLSLSSSNAFSGALSKPSLLSQPPKLPQVLRQVPRPAFISDGSALGQPMFHGEEFTQSSQHSTPSVSRMTLSGRQAIALSPAVGAAKLPRSPS